ncbi:MAG: DUF6049 family protein [Actinomycetota bacterium]|nr:DUF6049 family protein [Actinomycetota bacterium]
MVAESSPARRRADSSASGSSRRGMVVGDEGRRSHGRGGARRRVRGRALTLGLAVAALAGLAAAPIAANAGVDPVGGMQAMLASAGVDAASDSTGGRSSTRPPQSLDDEATGLRVRVSPTISTSLSFGAPVAISVEIENATGESLAPGIVRLVRTTEVIDDSAELDGWLASAGEAAADADGTSDGADAGIDAGTTVLAEGESRSLPAGGSMIVPFTIPGEAFADLIESPVVGLGAELRVGDTLVASGAAAYPNTGVPAAGSVAVALAAPLTAPVNDGATGLIDPAQLENWTGPTGLLTRQLDALAGRRVAIGLDPRIIASIRVLGSSAPPSAAAWLQRLANLPNEVFPLAYADADLAAQSQLGLPTPLAPETFSDVIDPANFTAPAAEEGGDGDPGTGNGQGETQTDAPTDAEPTPDAVPTTDEILAWPYTRTDIAWPADDSIVAGDLAFLDNVGLTTALLAPGNVESSGDALSASTNVDGSTALVADAGLTESLRAASVASTDTEWRAATGELLSELALDAGSARTTVLATFDRGAPSRSDRVSAVIDAIGGSGWSTLAGLSEAIGAPPEPRALVDEPESPDRLAAIERMVSAESAIAEFASVLSDERLLTGPTRRQLLSLLDVAWIDDPDAWNAAVSDWLAAQRSVLGAVSVVPSSQVNVVSSSSPLPTTIENTLPYPVTVIVEVEPSNGRLIVEDEVEITVEAESRGTVNVPIAAGVGNGEVSLAVSLTSPTGVPIGSTVTIPANVQADWEGLGAALLATIVVLVFGIGIWRNIRRRRRERAAAASDTDGDTETDVAAPALEAENEPTAVDAPGPDVASEPTAAVAPAADPHGTATEQRND